MAVSWMLWGVALLAGTSQAATLEFRVLARDGQPLADAVVRIEPTTPGSATAPAPTTVRIAQRSMKFVPAVSIVPVGSRVVFTNEDAWAHHVRGLPDRRSPLSGAIPDFGLRLAGQQQGQPTPQGEWTASVPGVIQLGCHLHGSMSGYLYVSNSRWVGKTDSDGLVSIADLPLGKAMAVAWHGDQLVDSASVAIEVDGDARLTLPTQIHAKRRR